MICCICKNKIGKKNNFFYHYFENRAKKKDPNGHIITVKKIWCKDCDNKGLGDKLYEDFGENPVFVKV
jgi:hypothetical protein